MSSDFPNLPPSPPRDRVDTAPLPPPPPPPPVAAPAGPYAPEPVQGPARPTVAGLAVASLVLGILWIGWIGSFLAVIFGHVALSQIKRAKGWKTGRGMALAGVVLGWIGMAMLALGLVGALVGAGDDDTERSTVGTSGSVSDDPGVLNGVYRYSWTLDELVAAGVPEEAVRQFAMAGVYTWTLDDGELEFRSVFPDHTWVTCDGTYRVRDDVLDLRLQSPCPPYRFTATWELTDDQLVMFDTAIDGQYSDIFDVWMAQKPWARTD